jgi:hypothetical protein
MPQNDLDELTGRTIDGVSRAARYLAAFDMIRDAILAGDLGYERAATEETARRWAALSHEERLEVAHPMVGKLGELSDAYRTAVAAMDVPYEASRRETQASISRWAEETFGPSGSNARAVARANREMSELLEHVTSDDQHPEAAEEVADIVIEAVSSPRAPLSTSLHWMDEPGIPFRRPMPAPSWMWTPTRVPGTSVHSVRSARSRSKWFPGQVTESTFGLRKGSQWSTMERKRTFPRGAARVPAPVKSALDARGPGRGNGTSEKYLAQRRGGNDARSTWASRIACLAVARSAIRARRTA